jgi:hypothetical protein
VPPHATHQVRLELEAQGTAVTCVGYRAPWRSDVGPEWTRIPIARLPYSPAHAAWALFWRDRNLRWHRHDRIDPAAHVDPLLAEIDADPTAISWA